MTSTELSYRPLRPRVKLAAALLLAGMLSGHVAYTCAEERTGATRPGESGNALQPLPDLEAAFWACDYAATVRWVSLDEGASCVAVTEEVKKRKFGGDFGRLMSWWKQNKAAEHRARADESRTRLSWTPTD